MSGFGRDFGAYVVRSIGFSSVVGIDLGTRFADAQEYIRRWAEWRSVTQYRDFLK